MTGNPSKPWKMLLPLGAVLLIAAIWSAYWFTASNYSRKAFTAERARLAEQGVNLTCGSERWGGFPFRFEWSCAPLSLESASLSANSASLRAVTLAYNPSHVLVFLDGPTSASEAGTPFTANVTGQTVASLEGLLGSGPRFSIDIPAASATGLGKASRILLHGRINQGKAELAAEIQAVSVQVPDQPPVDGVDLTLLASAPGDVASLARLSTDLQEGRATVNIDQLQLKAGTMSAKGKGTLSLDANHRIAGTFSAETNDIDGLLAVLAPIFQMKDADRTMIRNMLAAPGAPAPAKATFTAQDGALYWGMIPIGLLEPVY